MDWPTARGFCHPEGNSSPNHKPPPPTPVDFQGGEGAQPLTFPFGFCLWISLVDFAFGLRWLKPPKFWGTRGRQEKGAGKKKKENLSN